MKQTILLCILVLCIFCGSQAEYSDKSIDLVKLTDNGKTSIVAWSPHGNTILCIKDETSISKQLLLMESDGSNVRSISPVGNPFSAEFSWAGDKIAYMFSNSTDAESQAAVYVHDLKTGKTNTISAPYKLSDLRRGGGSFFSSDDRYIAYMARTGPSSKRNVWVFDTLTNKTSQLIPERGQSQSHDWSSSLPSRLCMQLSSNAGWDIAVVNPDGSGLVQITDNGSQKLDTNPPKWSEAEDLIAFNFDIAMTQSERNSRRSDTFVAKPDSSEIINLTNATSPVTEKQIRQNSVTWSWDGKWILVQGNRYDIQGNGISTLFLIDPHQPDKYETLITSHPRDGQLEYFSSYMWSYDSSKIAIISSQYTVRNWGNGTQFENEKRILSLLDINTRKRTNLITFDVDQDRKTIVGSSYSGAVKGLSWSPDNKSLIIAVADIISKTDNIQEPDVYRLDLSDEYISSSADQHYGPPMGRDAQPIQISAVTQMVEDQYADSEEGGLPDDLASIVTETISPINVTVDELMSSLHSGYAQYFTRNTTRNLLLFKGPKEILNEFKNDMKMIDTKPPQILVDLLAVELTDEANRALGLDWTFAQGSIGLNQPTGSSIFDLTNEVALGGLNTVAGAGQLFYQGVGTLPKEFFIRMNMLVQDGNGTILANPRTVAMSGKESMIQIRKTLNYFFNEGFDVSGRPIVKKSDISADTQGRIVPTLLANGKINLVVDVKVGSFTFTPDGGLPEQINRESSTEVTVQNGQTLIIGGLRQQEMNKVTSKVPLLGDLPVLGGLFKKEESEVRHSVLTLFITPKLLTDEQPNPEWPGINIEDINSPNVNEIISIMNDE